MSEIIVHAKFFVKKDVGEEGFSVADEIVKKIVKKGLKAKPRQASLIVKYEIEGKEYKP